MGRCLGQVIQHMNDMGLKYGFYSTYDDIVFLQRKGKYEFLVSDPVRARISQTPSARACLLYLLHCVSQSDATGFSRLEGRERDLLLMGKNYPRESLFSSPNALKSMACTTEILSSAPVTLNTAFIFDEESGSVRARLDIIQHISSNCTRIQQKHVYKAVIGGKFCAVKVWAFQLEKTYP